MLKFHHSKIARELLRQMEQTGIQVLSTTVSFKREFSLEGLLRYKGKSTNNERFIMNVLDAQFQSAVWRHKELLQQLIDTAMASQQMAFDCAKINPHSKSCLFCELAGKTASDCFMLAKNLFNGPSVSPQLLLQCAQGCKNIAAFVDKNPERRDQRLTGLCQQVTDACLNLYKKIGVN